MQLLHFRKVSNFEGPYTYMAVLKCLICNPNCEYSSTNWRVPVTLNGSFQFSLPKCDWRNSLFDLRIQSVNSNYFEQTDIFATGRFIILFSNKSIIYF